MNKSNAWRSVLLSIEKRHPCLNRLRVASRQSGRVGGRHPEELPAFLKIAIAAAVENLEAGDGKPLRLAMVAPRWSDGAFWTAAGATLCALKNDFERVQAHLPDFAIGQRLLLDKSKVVQYEGEDSNGLRLRVDNGRGVLTVPRSYRLRLQPTISKRPLSIVPFAGKVRPDLLDELLGIECQGARHIFSTRVALVSAVARAVETARHVYVGSDTENIIEPLPFAERMKVLGQIRRVRRRLFPDEAAVDPTDAMAAYLQHAEELAVQEKIAPVEQEELASCLRQAVAALRPVARHKTEGLELCEHLARVLAVVQPPIPEKPDALELLNLFQWGGLGLDGNLEIKSAGQVEAEPVLLLCPDLLPLRQYLRDKAAPASRSKEKNTFMPPLVVLDGAASFRNRLDILNGVLDSGAPVLVCLERGEEEVARPLTERGFEVWRWTPGDLAELAHEPDTTEADCPLFGGWQKALHNYSRHRLQEHVCIHDGIGAAADSLMDLLDGLDPAQPETKTLEGALYGSLLHVARLLHRPEGETEARLNERLGRARDELMRCGLWLTEETRNRADAVLQGIEDASSTETYEGKMAGLRQVVSASTSPSVAIVVAGSEEVESTRRQWAQWCREDESLADKTVSFCCPATAEAHLSATKAGHLIICGWLGAGRMRWLLDGCLAADISLLLYPFERGWLRGALWRWRGSGEHLSAARRVKLLGLSRVDLKIELRESSDEPLAGMQAEAPDTEKKASGFDASEFEMRLRVHRRASLASAGRPGEEMEAARLVELSGGHFAFLSDSCRLPLVNDLMLSSDAVTDTVSTRKSELPQKRGSELAVGDYVVFRRGAAGNLIRDMADLGLRRAGLGHLRALSRLWKTALREWVGAEQEHAVQTGGDTSRRAVIRKLQKAGIDRGNQAINEWLEKDRIIGPSDEAIVATIARITGHEELTRKLPEVTRAISKVRGSHLSASEHLARALLARLPEHLARSCSSDTFLEGALEVEIDGVGAAVVVRVEEIADDLAPVARSQINVLQREPEESHGVPADIFETRETKPRETLDSAESVDARTAAFDCKNEQMLREEGF